MIVWIIASLQFKSSKYAKRLSLLLIKSHGKVVQYLEKTFQSASRQKPRAVWNKNIVTYTAKNICIQLTRIIPN